MRTLVLLLLLTAIIGLAYAAGPKQGGKQTQGQKQKPLSSAEVEDCDPSNNSDDCIGANLKPCKDKYTACGANGICYCSDKNNNYDGVDGNLKSKCTVSAKAGEPCFDKCASRAQATTTTGTAYVCKIDDTNRCFCGYKQKKDKFLACKGPNDCKNKDKERCDKPLTCKTGEAIPGSGIIYPNVCDCTEGYKTTGCVEDSFCQNACVQAGAALGKACPSNGKMQCFCNSG